MTYLSGPLWSGETAPIPSAYYLGRDSESATELVETTRAYRVSLADRDETRSAQRAAIRSAIDAGVKQVDVARITGYNREHVRRILLSE